MNQKDKEVLAKYFPLKTLPFVFETINSSKFQLKITRDRITKNGDYRPPQGKIRYHTITVNHSLNPWAFFLVYLHELAHMHTWKKYNIRCKPHGREWKQEFSALLKHALFLDLFPEDLKIQIHKYSDKVTATLGSSRELADAIGKYDDKKKILVDDLYFEQHFRWHNNKIFRKGKKRRTRYECYCIDDKKYYLFNALAPVKEIIPDPFNQEQEIPILNKKI